MIRPANLPAWANTEYPNEGDCQSAQVMAAAADDTSTRMTSASSLRSSVNRWTAASDGWMVVARSRSVSALSRSMPNRRLRCRMPSTTDWSVDARKWEPASWTSSSARSSREDMQPAIQASSAKSSPRSSSDATASARW